MAETVACDIGTFTGEQPCKLPAKYGVQVRRRPHETWSTPIRCCDKHARMLVATAAREGGESWQFDLPYSSA